MRKPEYISPTALTLWLKDKDAYYKQYLADVKSIREPQTQPMAIGSSFDAYAKSYLYEALFGKNKDPKFSFQNLFEAQVEPQWRDWALENGKYVFEQYKQAGCLGDLMVDLQQANGEPRFEFDLKGVVHGYREGVERKFGEVVLLGKPDCAYITKNGNHCILDWKVSGYCSKYPKVPMTHYIALRSAGRTNHGKHKRCNAQLINEQWINLDCGLDDLDESWARQLSIYAWLVGNPVGSKFVTIVHQLCCSPTKYLPEIRVAEHHNYVGEAFQLKTFNKACELWEGIQKGHVFTDLSYEDNVKRMNRIDNPPIPMRVLDIAPNTNW